MAKFEIFSGNSSLGIIEASDQHEALRRARTMYQNVNALRVEPDIATSSEPSSSDYTMSPSGMRKMISKMTGRN